MVQTAIEHIKRHVNIELNIMDYYNGQAQVLGDMMLAVERSFSEGLALDERLINQLNANSNYELQQLFQEICHCVHDPKIVAYPWTPANPAIKSLIQKKYIQWASPNTVTLFIRHYVYHHLTRSPGGDFRSFISFLHGQGFTHEDIVRIGTFKGCFYTNIPHWHFGHDAHQFLDTFANMRPTPFTAYILPLLRSASGGPSAIKILIDELVFVEGHEDMTTGWLLLLLAHYPEGIAEDGAKYMVHWCEQDIFVNVPATLLLLNLDAVRYEAFLLTVLTRAELKIIERFQIMAFLNRKTPGKYAGYIEKTGEDCLNLFNTVSGEDQSDEIDSIGELSMAYLNLLFQENKQHGRARLEQFFREALTLPEPMFVYAQAQLGEDVLPLLVIALQKDPVKLNQYSVEQYYSTLFELFEQYNMEPYRDLLLDFAVNSPTSRARELACLTLRRDASVVPHAQALLSGKTVDQRATGTLLLSSIGTPAAEAALHTAVEAERNDDIRDAMLSALQGTRFKTPYNQEAIDMMVAQAANRKKLHKWQEKWIVEGELPKLYWRDQNETLSIEAVRFLFYRMKRAKGMNADPEARQLLNHIDRSRSQDFTRALLKAFQDSNADSNLRYYLTLSALLGGDELLRTFETLFNKRITDKRTKMAEYIVGALAMIGTDRALRVVEVIYRKFATKKPSISEAARIALDAAAQELNLTMDELADKLIPDFDFDGIYKTVTVADDEYRVFVSSDFTLNYLTEENTIRKSLPTHTPKALKTELKAIEKEIKDVIKSQSGRLEKYMIEERRWSVAHWQTFFFNNPIMFVYALKLLWGVYDSDGNLIGSFYCSEDTSLYDAHDEEVTLEEGQFVGILHPARLTETILNAWREKVYALSLVTIFPILERPVFAIPTDELDKPSTKMFYDAVIPKGADFVGTFLVKRNWRKTSAGGGRAEFTKPYKDGLLQAFANIEGPAAWYQGGTEPARMFEVRFMGKHWSDEIALKDVPSPFYSEVLADIQLMINN